MSHSNRLIQTTGAVRDGNPRTHVPDSLSRINLDSNTLTRSFRFAHKAVTHAIDVSVPRCFIQNHVEAADEYRKHYVELCICKTVKWSVFDMS